MSLLLTPLTIRNVTIRNRIVISPMCQYSSENGHMNDWHLVHLGSRASGGAGLVIAEATAISPEGRISPSDAGIWDDSHIAMMQRVVSFIHSQGAIAGIQIAHAGRKASSAVPWNGSGQLEPDQGGWIAVGPSAIPFRDGQLPPESLDKNGINKVISDFKAAASRALTAGFKVLEIHGAHGYLVHEFLSPHSNHRDDEYGGSFENRTRLLREIIEVVRKVWPDEYPLFVRLSITEWTDNQWSPEESISLAPILKDLGADLIDCSTGGNNPLPRIPVAPGYQVPFAEMIRKTGIMTGAVGMITGWNQAETILQEGKADIVLLARESLRNPYFPLMAARDMGEDIQWPVQYLRAKKF